MDNISLAAFNGKPVDVPVIDAHCHILPYRLNGWYQAFDKTSDIVSHLDDLGIDCIVTAPHSLISGTMEQTNGEALKAATDFQGRIYCYISILPHEGLDEVKRQIDKYSKNPVFIGFKFLPGYHGSLLQQEYDYALDFANEVNCPVLCHTWGNNPPIDEFRQQMKKRPHTKFLVAHQGGGLAECTDRLILLMKEYETVNMELCGSLTNSYSVEEIISMIGDGRLVYGSDLINLDPRYDFGKVVFSPIDYEVKKKVLAENYLEMLQNSQMGKIII
ncbi:MAG: metal-dependent hydrolase [Clostridia bacterium]|nr:metal-dependent hydrolase [Clostridia bacterium]